MIGRLGRTPECSRFPKLPLGTTARDHALRGCHVFLLHIHHAAFVKASSGETGQPEHMWATSRDFIEIPLDLRRKSDWRPVRWGRWNRLEHITLLEARTAVRA